MQIELSIHELTLCIEGLRTVYRNRKDCGELTKDEALRYEVLVGKLALALATREN